MRIAIATTSGFHLRHLARELIASGHEVAYLTYLPPFRNRRDGIPAVHARSYFWRLLPWSAAALFRHAHRLQARGVQKLFRRADALYAVDLPPCDIFIGLSALADASARAAREKYRAKIVIERGSRHVASQNELLVAGGGQRLSAHYVARELTSYERADYIALPSDHAVESFVERGFARQRLFKNSYGVDLARFAPTPRPPGPARLLFVGQWSHRKGCDVLAEVLRRNPDLHLTHIGTAHDLSFPALPNFTTLGHKPHPELHAEMARRHMLLLPSREDGFGMVLTEALATGLPVIGSTRTGAPDLRELIANRESVIVVPPADAGALATAIRRMENFIARQPEDRAILTEKDKSNLSWAAYARRYSAFLHAIV
ncbi:glycosyltransferase family 4 protein [Rhodoblastus acidophilus]|uniref:Glycosyltransferase family 4 protein n=1 Tax=Candidatus Rhodoblastus alkanivorans TaxID=2954117 RepID=A0ABS9Z6J4_9HYPH|nr:glycosyltransferase family 4 protein [Candidatus Rhodoblastus alkanivorans]MCI4679538.1 glycosyltransferase family 4 protein [Candidatus Rhodoblastus alkanivorans]MCI4683289.1 glycosyltransferase family 4 protein [Candidatus Rhodoblastus alkanivorans]MDI4640601.1 glycosyltransferase family 4 protein [Rhodoblastus acidophilus]